MKWNLFMSTVIGDDNVKDSPTVEKDKPPEEQRRRVQLDFNEVSWKRLSSLKEKVGARSTADLVRIAIRLLEWFSDRQARGEEVVVVDKKNDTQRRVELLLH